MATDATLLAIGVDSSGVQSGTAALAGLETQAGRTEASTTRFSQSMRDQAAIVQRQMETMNVSALQQANSFIALSDAAQRVVNRYDPLGAKLRQLQADFANLNAEVSRGAGAGSEAAIDKTYAALNAEITKTSGLMTTAGAAGVAGFGEATQAAEGFASMTIRGRTELIVLAHEMLQGRFSRIPGSIMVMTESMRLAGGAVALFAGAIAPVVAVLATLGYGLYEVAKANDAMDNALTTTGNFAGETRASIWALAQTMSDTGSITVNAAAAIATQIVASGRFTSDNVQKMAMMAEDFGAAIGESAEKATPKLIKMFEDPARSIDGLNSQYHFLTVAQEEEIKSLEREGEQQQAVSMALDAFAKRLPDHVAQLGGWRTAIDAVAKAFSNLADSAANKLMGTTQADPIQARIDALQAGLQTHVGVFGVSQEQHDMMEEELRMLEQAKTSEGLMATARAKENAEMQRTIDDQKIIDTGTSARAAALQQIIDRLRKDEDADVAAGAKRADVESKINDLVRERENLLKRGQGKAVDPYADQSAALNAELARERDFTTAAKQQYDERIAMLSEYHAKLGMSEGAFDAGRANARAEYVASEQKSYDAEVQALSQTVVKSSKQYEELQAKWQTVDAAHAKFQADMAKTDVKGGVDDLAAQAKAYEDMQKAIDKAGDSAIASLDKQIAAQQLHNAEIGKTKEQVDALRQAQDDAATAQMQAEALAIQGLLAENDLNAQARAIYADLLRQLQQEIDKRRELSGLHAEAKIIQDNADAAKEAERAWHSASNSIENDLITAFDDWVHGAKNLGQQLRDELLKMFDTLILRPILQPVAGGVAGMFTGGAGGAGGIGSIFSGVNGISSIGSMLTGAGGFISGLGGSFAGGVGSSLANIGDVGLLSGLGGDFSAGFSALGAGNILGGIGSLAGAALPVVGIGLAIASALGMFNSSHGPKSGGFGQTGSDFGRFYTPSGQDASLVTLANTSLTSYNTLLSSLGGTGAANFGFGFDEDPNGTANSRVSAGATVNGKRVYDVLNQDAGRGDKGVQADLQLDAQRAILAALQASNLPKDIANILDSVVTSTATLAQIQQVEELATAYGDMAKELAANPLQDALASITTQAQGAYGAFGLQTTAFEKLLKTYDGSTAATTALDAASQGYYTSLVALLAQIQQVKQSMDTMFSDTIRGFKLKTLDPQGQYGFYQSEVSGLMKQLSTAADPTTVQNIETLINQDLQAAFGLLDPSQQAQLLGKFTNAANAADAAGNTRLTQLGANATTTFRDDITNAQKAITKAASDLATAANTISQAATTQSTAATTQSNAANTQLNAANTPITLNVNVGSTTTEVNIG